MNPYTSGTDLSAEPIGEGFEMELWQRWHDGSEGEVYSLMGIPPNLYHLPKPPTASLSAA